MSHQRVLLWVVLLMAGLGLFDSGAAGGDADRIADLHLLAGLATSYLCFLWYRGDSDARGFRRSRWLSVGVIAFTLGAIPYYLVRSRRADERAPALLAYAAYVGVTVFAVWVGMAIPIGLA